MKYSSVGNGNSRFLPHTSAAHFSKHPSFTSSVWFLHIISGSVSTHSMATRRSTARFTKSAIIAVSNKNRPSASRLSSLLSHSRSLASPRNSGNYFGRPQIQDVTSSLPKVISEFRRYGGIYAPGYRTFSRAYSSQVWFR